MTEIDYVIIGIVVASALFGLFRGFLREVCAIITWIAAIWLSWKFAPSLEPYLGGTLRQPPFGLWAARAIVFILVLIAGSIGTALVSYFARLPLFSTVDRFLGFLFGLARGVLVVGVLVLLGQYARMDSESWWRESKLIAQVAPVADALASLAGERLPKPIST
jgi:membrane protein required for colicin V production